MDLRTILRVLGLAFAASFVILGCQSNNAAEPKAAPPVPVVAYKVETGAAAYYDEYPATVVALNQVDLRPQVSGYITDIYFKDGQHVSKGMKLYSIDQRLYKAAFDQATANLNVALSNQAKAKQDFDRYTDLAKNDAVARQTLDHAAADLESAKMQVAAADAAVKTAEANLHYSVIIAPFDCTIGISLVKTGSAVTAGQSLLNTVSSDNPMAVDCSVDEKQIGRFLKYLQQKRADDDSSFTIAMPDRSVYQYPGHLSLLDRAVDPQTGTIRVRLVFPNPQNVLRPGMNCNLRVRNNGASNSLLIPYKAVVEQMGEYFVFVVTNGNKVTQRRVSLGAPIKDAVVIRDGLQPGDEVVIEGVQKLRENSPVMVSMAKSSSAVPGNSASSPTANPTSK